MGEIAQYDLLRQFLNVCERILEKQGPYLYKEPAPQQEENPEDLVQLEEVRKAQREFLEAVENMNSAFAVPKQDELVDLGD